MEIKASKESICINHIVGQKTENFIVEGDEIVPDIKPDVLNIISNNGIVCIEKTEIQDGKIRFDGSICIYTLYIADDENSSIKTINTNMNFSKIFDIPNVNSDMQIYNKLDIFSIDCKILNGRKLSFQVELKLDLNMYSNDNIEILKDIEDLSDIQKLNKSYQIDSLVGRGTTKVFAKDTIKIDSADNLSEIVKAQVIISNKETKISYNKVLVKSDYNIKIVYLTDDNRVSLVNATIPVMGFIDIAEVSDENFCDVVYEMKNISIKPNNIEEHSIYVEAEVEISCSVYENKSIDIIQDLYSPSKKLECQQSSVKIMQNKRNIKQICSIKKQELISSIENSKVYDVDIIPRIINSKIANGNIMYEGELNATILFSNNDGNSIMKENVLEPFSFTISDSDISLNTNVDTNIEIITQDFVIMPDGTSDIKVDLEFDVNISNMENINIISDVTELENRDEERSSIVIYYTKAGDTLWNIAKKFGSTIDNIVKTNNIEDVTLIMPGEQLFITR